MITTQIMPGLLVVPPADINGALDALPSFTLERVSLGEALEFYNIGSSAGMQAFINPAGQGLFPYGPELVNGSPDGLPVLYLVAPECLGGEGVPVRVGFGPVPPVIFRAGRGFIITH